MVRVQVSCNWIRIPGEPPGKLKSMPARSGDTQNWTIRCSPRLVSMDDPPTWGGNLNTLHNLLTWTYTLRYTSGRWKSLRAYVVASDIEPTCNRECEWLRR